MNKKEVISFRSKIPFSNYVYADTLEDIVIRELPNGVKDEVIKENGSYKFKKNIGKKILESSDITSLDTTSYSNFDFVLIKKPLDYKYYNVCNGDEPKAFNGDFPFNLKTSIYDGTWDLTENENSISSNFSTISFGYLTPKGKYSDLTSARNNLAGMSLIYQLETTEVHKIKIDPDDFIIFKERVKDPGIIDRITTRFYYGQEKELHVIPLVVHKGNKTETMISYPDNTENYLSGDDDILDFNVSVEVDYDDEIWIMVKNKSAVFDYDLVCDVSINYFNR